MALSIRTRHARLNARIKTLTAQLRALEAEAVEAGKAEYIEAEAEVFQWSKSDVIAQWGTDVWQQYKRRTVRRRLVWADNA